LADTVRSSPAASGYRYDLAGQSTGSVTSAQRSSSARSCAILR
jgi:hypothetical protein